MTQGANQILGLRIPRDKIRAFKHIPPMSTRNGDNQGAIPLAHNPEYHARTKYIDIQYCFIRDVVTTETIYLHFCPSTDMIEDIMTRALPQPAHEQHRLAMWLKNRISDGPPREGMC